MLSVTQAFDKLLATVKPLNVVSLPLSDLLGLTLAEDVSAPCDSPPFDKSLMDGFAVRAADVASGFASLKVIELVTAGQVPSKSVGPGEATQIMTGAPIPEGADLVVRIEETLPDIDSVHITTKSIAPGTNIIRRGTSVRAGDVVLQAGMKLNGSRIGALAELGRAIAPVYRRPTVAILATGDELVPIAETPGPGQIRNSNEAMLIAQIQAAGAIPIPLGIARDNRADLKAKIQEGLQCDMLVLSGGVSAGMLDLVPSELATAGVREVFHKVELKPGKPVWFGVHETDFAPTESALPQHEFSLDDFSRQMKLFRKIGLVTRRVRRARTFEQDADSNLGENAEADIQRVEVIIDCLSLWEKNHLEQIDDSRKQRIVSDSGTTTKEVERVLRRFRSIAATMQQAASISGRNWLTESRYSFQLHDLIPAGSRPNCYVFGLPGNPVSSLVCCELFVRTAIRRLMGEQTPLPRPLPARLEHDYSARADRPTYHPAKLMWSPEGATVKLVPWHGSSDLCGTVAANGMAFLSGEAKEYHAGDMLEVIPW